jgi:hypothetical protein
MKPSRYFLLALFAVIAGRLPGQDGVKPIIAVPPLTDPKKKPDPVKPPPQPLLPQAAKPEPAAPGMFYAGNFDGSDLGKEWKLVNPDPDRWTMQPKRKSIMMITQPGGCPYKKDAKNELILDKDLPQGDFEVIVKASARFQAPGNRIAMILFQDEANYFWTVLQKDGSYGYPHNLYFQKIFQGQTTGTFSKDTNYAGDVYLKIDRDGNEYTGSYAMIDPAKPGSTDQVQWTALGTLPWIRFQGRLALCADNFQAAPEVSAEFYSVAIRKK